MLRSLLLGGVATVAAGPAIRSQLFGVAPHDYSMLGGSAVLLAARLDPMEALREE